MGLYFVILNLIQDLLFSTIMTELPLAPDSVRLYTSLDCWNWPSTRGDKIHKDIKTNTRIQDPRLREDDIFWFSELLCCYTLLDYLRLDGNNNKDSSHSPYQWGGKQVYEQWELYFVILNLIRDLLFLFTFSNTNLWLVLLFGLLFREDDGQLSFIILNINPFFVYTIICTREKHRVA